VFLTGAARTYFVRRFAELRRFPTKLTGRGWNHTVFSNLIETIRGTSMPTSQLKRAERTIQSIRGRAELPPETADVLQELVDVVRYIESRLSALENNGKPHPTELVPVPIELVGDGP
jgi:hypothetical protein